MSESQELPSWTTQCGSETLCIIRVVRDDGAVVWELDNGKIHRVNPQFPTFESVEHTFNTAKSMIESNHQNNLQCCVNPDYAIGPTRILESEGATLEYVTPCKKQRVTVVRKTTMTGRDVWDIINDNGENPSTHPVSSNPVAMMLDSFESAKSSFEHVVKMLKSMHEECCTISDD
jgi:hypothetical protein